MNIIRKLTWENLRRNPKRTIVTILGVILSTALICGAAGLVSSARDSIILYEKRTAGDFHVLFYDVPEDQVRYVTENANVEDSFVWENVGYAVAEQSKNEDKPYFAVTAMTEESMSRAALTLVSGRMPEKEGEILYPNHGNSNGQMTYRVGDVLTLEVGTRRDGEGNVLTQRNAFESEIGEKITDTVTQTYTIVGTIQRPITAIEDWSAPGYTLITYLPEEKDISAGADTNIGVRYTKAANYQTYTQQITNVIRQNTGETVETSENRSLLRYEGALSGNDLQMLYAVGAVILLIIMLTSIFVIRNSFQISVAEKTAQYGMLASVGATARQIRASVLYEGFLIGLAGIPLGIAGGAASVLILCRIVTKLLFEALELEFIFSLPWGVIVLTVVLAGLTIFFSSLIPAVRAGRIPPIVAIRGNDQVKISGKEVRISPLTRKLFGIGGVIAAKNLKRSKSKYRTTVISLVVSIAVFVSISGFVNYMKRSVSYAYTDYDYNLSLTGINDEEKVDDLMREVGESVYASFRLTYAQSTGEYASEEMRAYYGDRWDEKIMPTIVIYDDAYFEKYARSEGIMSDYRTAAILSDVTILFDENGGRRQIHLYKNIEGKTLPVDFTEYDVEADEERVVWTTDITITKLAEKMPMGNEDHFSGNGTIFVAKSFFPAEFYETVPGVGYSRTVVNAQDADACERRIREVMQGSPDYSGIGIYNIEANVRQEHNMILVIEIFLYGFITVITLVGVTNIFNTITTNMILRSKEFAMLKSIGMTTKQFHRMIRLESLLYGMKSLLIGLPIGTAGSYLIYLAFRDSLDMGYLVPWKAMAVSAAAVFVIVGMTMWYSLAKIEKQNIVETIRSDAI